MSHKPTQVLVNGVALDEVLKIDNANPLAVDQNISREKVPMPTRGRHRLSVDQPTRL